MRLIIAVLFSIMCLLLGYAGGYDMGKAIAKTTCALEQLSDEIDETHAFMGLPPPPDCNHLDGEAWNVCMGVGRK